MVDREKLNATEEMLSGFGIDQNPLNSHIINKAVIVGKDEPLTVEVYRLFNKVSRLIDSRNHGDCNSHVIEHYRCQNSELIKRYIERYPRIAIQKHI